MASWPHCSVCGVDVDPSGRRASLLIVNESGSGQRIRYRFDHLCPTHTEAVRTYVGKLNNAHRDGPYVGSPLITDGRVVQP